MIFLTAEWRWLAMLNWEVDPALLASRVPKGTELDSWNGKTFLSVIGFRFLNTRVLGLGIPWHRHFDEVNLRFYVRRGKKRGVVFIQEIVPRWAIAKLARVLYSENYFARPMSHEINLPSVDYSAAETPFFVASREKTAGGGLLLRGSDCRLGDCRNTLSYRQDRIDRSPAQRLADQLALSMGFNGFGSLVAPKHDKTKNAKG